LLFREARPSGSIIMESPVKADETWVGGREKNKYSRENRKPAKARSAGSLFQAYWTGPQTRNRVRLIEKTDTETLRSFVVARADEAAAVYTNNTSAYHGVDRNHETAHHSVGEYVRDGFTPTAWDPSGALRIGPPSVCSTGSALRIFSAISTDPPPVTTSAQ